MKTLSFRLFILASLFGATVAGMVDFVFPHLVPVGATQAIEAEAPFQLLEHGWFQAVLALWIGASFCSAIGLLFFQRWARSMALWTTGGGFLLYPLFGPSVSSGWSSAFTEVSAVLWGAAIALAYFSPICSRFEAIRNDS
jgi:hypothetical protein